MNDLNSTRFLLAGTGLRLVDLSARPSSPVVPDRAPYSLVVRSRARLASLLRSAAGALEPRRTATPACR